VRVAVVQVVVARIPNLNPIALVMQLLRDLTVCPIKTSFR